METNNTGTQQGAEQTANTGTQQTAGQSEVQQQQSQQTAQTTQQQTQQGPTPEQIAQWQQKAQDAEKWEKQYNALLPEYTRSRQALAQLAGNPQQQPQDPFSDVVELAKSKGYSPEDARAIAEVANLVATKQTNAAMQQFAYQQVGNQIPIVMSQAWQKAPAAFSNPKVQEALQTHLWQLANNGQFDQITPDYTANMAKILAFDQGAYAPPAQQQANTNPFSQGMFGIPQGFSQPPQQQKQDSPVVQKVTSEIQQRYGKPAQ